MNTFRLVKYSMISRKLALIRAIMFGETNIPQKKNNAYAPDEHRQKEAKKERESGWRRIRCGNSKKKTRKFMTQLPYWLQTMYYVQFNALFGLLFVCVIFRLLFFFTNLRDSLFVVKVYSLLYAYMRLLVHMCCTDWRKKKVSKCMSNNHIYNLHIAHFFFPKNKTLT